MGGRRVTLPSPHPDPQRLGNLLRLMLGTTSEGEALAARAAFLREVEAQGLNLHDIGRRIEQSAGGSALPESTTVPHTAAGAMERDLQWESAVHLADTIEDGDWPAIAQWLVDQDTHWVATRQRHILKHAQLAFSRQILEEAHTIRPSQRQCAWLLCLTWHVAAENQRPAISPRPRISETTPIGPAPSEMTPVGPTPLPPRRKRARPVSLFTDHDRLKWIAAVVSRQCRAAVPIKQSEQPPLFTGEAVRVLTWLAIQHHSWRISTTNGPIEKTDTPSAAQLAAATHVSLRSVRRILAQARKSGFLVVVRKGGKGKGISTIHRLVVPHPRQWRSSKSSE